MQLARWYACRVLRECVGAVADAAAGSGEVRARDAEDWTAHVLRTAALVGVLSGVNPEAAPVLPVDVARDLVDLIADANHDGVGPSGSAVFTPSSGACLAARLRVLVEAAS